MIMRTNLIDTFLFGFERAPGVPETGAAMMLGSQLTYPRRRAFKAVLKSTGKIAGFGKSKGCFRENETDAK
jgi:hypothetical protein